MITWYIFFTTSVVGIPYSGNRLRFVFGTMAKVWMIYALIVCAVSALHRVGTRNWNFFHPVPTPGAAEYLTRKPQPDWPTLSTGGMFGEIHRHNTLIHFTTLLKGSGKGGQSFYADVAVMPVIDIFRGQRFSNLNRYDSQIMTGGG